MAPYGNNSIVAGGYNGPALVDFNIPFPMGTGSYFSPITSPNLGIGVGADGMVWLAVTQYPRPPFNAIIGFDPHWDGDPWSNPLTILSDATHGSGPAFYAPAGLYVVPEPSSIVLALFGALALVGLTAHRR